MYPFMRRSGTSRTKRRNVRRVPGKQIAKYQFKHRVNRRLSYEQPRAIYSRRSIEDIHSGPTFTLPNQCDFTSYVTLPSYGVEGNGGRSFDHIKLMNLRVSGTVNVTAGIGDDPMGSSAGLNGIFILSVIIDKKPFLPEGVNALPTFKELFGEYESIYGRPSLKENIRYRYRLLGSTKQYLKTEDVDIQRPFNLRLTISNNRISVWASFHDADSNSCLGNYKNINKNAIIVNCAWVSLVSSKCKVYSQFVLNYIG
ncbi:nuclear shuttle protein [Begomovirus pyrenacanthae]|nr:nuclear shuttle protein [Begomovirus pyrenacanthae]